ncbi:hypothetical protein [Anaerococcus vaginalis]|uniref:hypothetical protein n=1 Tax=Anaerococcus vaginalis TaxID=33037 RepID=UPI002904E89B|nr:hypothetical protein [Anaerococcus vaginalis]MDU2375379.1 hypothetical protein [Anaerococcus vaginalis]
MSLNTLNLKQKQGGRIIKQADRSSTFKFALQDANGALINLNGEEASISLFNPNIKKYWSTKANVKDTEVEFKLPGNIEENDYVLEITVGGYVFPSDNDFIIEVVKGFKDLPDMETGLRYKQSIEEITQEYIERSDKKLKENLDGITEQRVKIDKANAEILKNINDTGSKYINDINSNYANVKLEFDKNVQQRKDEFKTIADNDLKTLKTTSDEALKNLKKTGDSYINNLVINYNSAKTEFGKNASQKNEELKNNYDTYVTNLENKKDDVITLIGNKKEEVFTEIDGQVKISADKYLSEFKENIDNKVDKIDGKELSDNNFSNEYKNKLDGLDSKFTALENMTDSKIQENTNKINQKVDKVDKKIINLNLLNGLTGFIKALKDPLGGVTVWGVVTTSNMDYIYKNTSNWAVLPAGYRPSAFVGFSLNGLKSGVGAVVVQGMGCNADGEIYYKGIKSIGNELSNGFNCHFSFYFKAEGAW